MPSSKEPLRRPFVLLVDDDAPLRETLAELLEDGGLDVLALPDAGAVLALAGDVPPPALLVTDVNLGAGMDGFALSAAARLRWPGLRTVLVTGDAGAAVRGLASSERLLPKPSCRGAASSERLLLKPFRASQLLAAVQDALRKAAVEAEP